MSSFVASPQTNLKTSPVIFTPPRLTAACRRSIRRRVSMLRREPWHCLCVEYGARMMTELVVETAVRGCRAVLESEDVSERKIRFISRYPTEDLFERIENRVMKMGFQVQKGHGKLKAMQQRKGLAGPRSLGSFSIAAEVFEINPSLYVVELRKFYGDSSLYRELCTKLSDDLGICGQLLKTLIDPL